MRRVCRRLLRDERGAIFGVAVTPAGWVVILTVVALTALGTVAAGYAFQKKTQTVGGMTFQQVLEDTPAPATPKPAPVDTSSNSAPTDNSPQQAPPPVVQQPVDQPPVVVVTNGGGTDDGSSSSNGSSSSSSSGSSSGNCPDHPLIGGVHPDSGPMDGNC